MALILVQAPVDDVVSLERAKQHLNVDSSHHDQKIADLVAAATAWLDGEKGVLGRSLRPQRWQLNLSGFPCYAIALPLPPAVDVISVTYLDAAGTEQTLDADAYRLVGGGSGATYVIPKQDTIWPVTNCEPDAVRVLFDAGYAPSAPEIEPLRRAILMMVERWYDEEGGDDVPAAVELADLQFPLLSALTHARTQHREPRSPHQHPPGGKPAQRF